jgi:hypothetical protein
MGRSIELGARAVPQHRPGRRDVLKSSLRLAWRQINDPRSAQIARRVDAARTRQMQYQRGGRWS